MSILVVGDGMPTSHLRIIGKKSMKTGQNILMNFGNDNINLKLSCIFFPFLKKM